MSAKPAGESLENARKPHSIYARTAQYFGECFLYNSNSIAETPSSHQISTLLKLCYLPVLFLGHDIPEQMGGVGLNLARCKQSSRPVRTHISIPTRKD